MKHHCISLLVQEFQFLKESTECFDDGMRSCDVEAGLGEQLDFQLAPSDIANPFSMEAKLKQSGTSSHEVKWLFYSKTFLALRRFFFLLWHAFQLVIAYV